MRIYDLIAKKRDGGTHSREELEAIVNGFVSGEVADYDGGLDDGCLPARHDRRGDC